MINIPRALFQSRTGRQPIYHIGIEEMQDWAYAGEPLVPLKGYPGRVLEALRKEETSRQVRPVLMQADIVRSGTALGMTAMRQPANCHIAGSR